LNPPPSPTTVDSQIYEFLGLEILVDILEGGEDIFVAYYVFLFAFKKCETSHEVQANITLGSL
jgi:hypothetical protein